MMMASDGVHGKEKDCKECVPPMKRRATSPQIESIQKSNDRVVPTPIMIQRAATAPIQCEQCECQTDDVPQAGSMS